MKEKIKRYVMLGERNTRRIKKQTKQYDIEEFICEIYGGATVKPEFMYNPKITVWDVLTGKHHLKMANIIINRLDNDYYNRRVLMKLAMNEIIEEDK